MLRGAAAPSAPLLPVLVRYQMSHLIHPLVAGPLNAFLKQEEVREEKMNWIRCAVNTNTEVSDG